MAQLAALVVYALVSIFTPGPNNVTSAAAGAKLGWKRSLPYRYGITLGFFVVMFLSGFLNLSLSAYFSSAATWVKWIGCAYLTWLAVSLFIGGSGHGDRSDPSFSMIAGILLQIVNPKAILFGITLYGMFSGILLRGPASILLSAAVLSLLAFAAISLWCLVGTALSKKLENRTARLAFNIVLSALLVLTAISVALG